MPHPKEVLLNTNDKCLIARELHLALSQVSSEFCYPYGCSLNLEKPSQCLALSGPISFPVDRPIIALHETPGSLNQAGGRLIVSGSTHIFHDSFLDLSGCANFQLAEIIFAWLLNLDGQLELQASFGDVEIADYRVFKNGGPASKFCQFWGILSEIFGQKIYVLKMPNKTKTPEGRQDN